MNIQEILESFGFDLYYTCFCGGAYQERYRHKENVKHRVTYIQKFWMFYLIQDGRTVRTDYVKNLVTVLTEFGYVQTT